MRDDAPETSRVDFQERAALLSREVEYLKQKLTGVRKSPELFYSVQSVALIVGRCEKQVIKDLKEGKFGTDVVDLAKDSPEDEPKSHDYRIPAAGVNFYLSQRRVFSSAEELGISARSVGELRRNVAKEAS